MKTRLIFSAFLVCLVSLSFAQNRTETKKMLYYTFTGPSTVSELEELKKEVLLLDGVKEVKAECKAEKKAAQLRIVFIERKRQHESDPEFDIAAVKKLIQKYNYVPGDFKIEETE